MREKAAKVVMMEVMVVESLVEADDELNRGQAAGAVAGARAGTGSAVLASWWVQPEVEAMM